MSVLEISEIFGNFGEFVGAIAVVVTLLFVGLQLRQNTQALRSATMQSIFEATNDVWKHNSQGDLARTQEMVVISQKSDRGPAEDLFYRSWVILTFRTQENIYYQNKQGFADSYFSNLEKRVRGSMSLPYMRQAWTDGLVQDFLSDEYVAFVNRIIAEG